MTQEPREATVRGAALVFPSSHSTQNKSIAVTGPDAPSQPRHPTRAAPPKNKSKHAHLLHTLWPSHASTLLYARMYSPQTPAHVRTRSSRRRRRRRSSRRPRLRCRFRPRAPRRLRVVGILYRVVHAPSAGAAAAGAAATTLAPAHHAGREFLQGGWKLDRGGPPPGGGGGGGRSKRRPNR